MLYRYSQNKKGRPIKTAVIYTEKEHCIKNSLIDPNAIKTIKQLRDYGFEAYIVGGAVRDLLVQKEPKDFDLVTNATPTKIKKIFRNSRIIGKRFRIVHVFYGQTIFEVTTFRSKNHEESENVFGSMDEDVFRRDFSMNALYYDPLKNHIIDYVNGFKDIQKNKIIPVIPLKNIFIEDPVRMLRAVKYASTTGFSIPLNVKRKIKKQSNLLSQISASRLTEELLKIINSGNAYEIVNQALDTNLYTYLQPAASDILTENAEFRKNYFASLKALDAASKVNKTMRLGEKLTYFIFDFITLITNTDFDKSNRSLLHEIHISTWKMCRNFVLPMNPQRTELEFAIQASLKKLGIPVKQPRKPRRPRKETNA